MSPNAGKVLVQSDDGRYTAWSAADQPELAAEGLGCGLHELPARVLTMPRYADCPMFGYVLRGSGVAGVIPAARDATQKLVWLKAGDRIALRTGDVTWWYNDNLSGRDELLLILFMADTAHAVSPGDISYFFLAGRNSVLRGLDAAAWAPAMTAEQATAAFRGQTAVLSTMINQGLSYTNINTLNGRDGLVVNTQDVAPAGTVKTVTRADLAVLGALGISVAVGRLEPGAACAPWVVRDGGAQAVFVDRGSARVQVSSAAGGDTLLLDQEVSAGDLFVVPRFAVASLTATGRDRLEWVSLIKSPRAAEQLIGEDSLFDCMQAEVVEASLLNGVAGSPFHKEDELLDLLTGHARQQ